MEAARTGRYYARELRRRLAHYAAVRRHGYRDHGSLETATETILGVRTRWEVDRPESLLAPYGNVLEVCTLEGEPYVKRGYASAGEFTVAAALWTEYQHSLA